MCGYYRITDQFEQNIIRHVPGIRTDSIGRRVTEDHYKEKCECVKMYHTQLHKSITRIVITKTSVLLCADQGNLQY